MTFILQRIIKQILVSAVKTVNQGNVIKVVRKGLSDDEIRQRTRHVC